MPTAARCSLKVNTGMRQRKFQWSKVSLSNRLESKADVESKTKNPITEHYGTDNSSIIQIRRHVTIVIIILAVIVLPQAIRILREYERGVIFRLGKCTRAAPRAGVDLPHPHRGQDGENGPARGEIDVAKQEVMTGQLPATVDAVVYFRVVDRRAVVKVEKYWIATSLIAQTDAAQRARPARWTTYFAARHHQPEVTGNH